MSSFGSCFLVLIIAAGLLVGCSSKETPEDQAAQTPSTGNQEPTTTEVVAVEESMEDDLPPAEPEEFAEPSEPSEPTKSVERADPMEPPDPVVPIELPDPTEPETPAQSGDPMETPASKVEVPSGPVRVQATKDGLTAIGVDLCAKCHKIQYASWLETEHAKLTPALDCEACHGPGSEYKSLKIMKDPEASRAAGLVHPSPTFCANCHVSGWEDEQLKRAHAHKTPGGE